ncbi:MAG: glycosyltransferase family 4 protein [Desulfobulbaceae bacterium]|nr:glycosyltransferase family 4 protein [Desulfobulbaceae bacterium]
MKIGLDASRFLLPTGEGTYTREVVRHLIRLFPDDHFLVVIPKFEPEFDAPNVEQYIRPAVDGITARLRYGFEIGRIASSHHLDVFHCLTNYAAFNVPCPVVCNVMDLATLKYPQLRPSRLQWLIYRFVFPFLLKCSRFLVAISKSTGRDLYNYYGFADSVRVVYCGVDHETFNLSASLDRKLLARFRLPPNYLMFVGYLSPKKNLEVVLRAMAKLRAEDLPTTLVVVGKRGYGSEFFFELVEELGLEGQVIETGFVSQQELTLLYREAGLFVFPSIYEGFGLPVVEAMACGSPVLVSDVGPLPEIVEDASCLCAPDDVEGWATGIRRALTDPSYRERMQIYGFERAALFSWERAAQQLRTIYAEAVEDSRG